SRVLSTGAEPLQLAREGRFSMLHGVGTGVHRAVFARCGSVTVWRFAAKTCYRIGHVQRLAFVATAHQVEIEEATTCVCLLPSHLLPSTRTTIRRIFCRRFRGHLP